MSPHEKAQEAQEEPPQSQPAQPPADKSGRQKGQRRQGHRRPSHLRQVLRPRPGPFAGIAEGKKVQRRNQPFDGLRHRHFDDLVSRFLALLPLVGNPQVLDEDEECRRRQETRKEGRRPPPTKGPGQGTSPPHPEGKGQETSQDHGLKQRFRVAGEESQGPDDRQPNRPLRCRPPHQGKQRKEDPRGHRHHVAQGVEAPELDEGAAQEDQHSRQGGAFRQSEAPEQEEHPPTSQKQAGGLEEGGRPHRREQPRHDLQGEEARGLTVAQEGSAGAGRWVEEQVPSARLPPRLHLGERIHQEGVRSRRPLFDELHQIRMAPGRNSRQGHRRPRTFPGSSPAAVNARGRRLRISAARREGRRHSKETQAASNSVVAP